MHEEFQYLNLLKDIIEKGTYCSNRTKVNTIKSFGHTMRFNLTNDTIPVFTTKKVYFKSIAHELLWFMGGDTNIKYLKDNGVHIWDFDAKKHEEKIKSLGGEFYSDINNILNSKNLVPWYADEQYYKIGSDGVVEFVGEGELGPVYGQQWRNFGGNILVNGVDQLAEAIKKIQTNPDDRRIIVSAWNPNALEEMALAPCHLLFQFGVEDNKYLTCAMYQRSCDLGLGVPFNIASYSLLTHIIAKATGLEAKEFIWFGFDCHIYENHKHQILEQISRDPFPFPKIKLNEKIYNSGLKILEKDFISIKDISLENYNHHQAIKMDLADY